MVALHGRERFGESWHRAPGLPPALRFLLAPMSGIHLGTVKFNIPGFFYMNYALKNLSGSKLKAKNAALQSDGLAEEQVFPQWSAAPVLHLDPFQGKRE